MTKTIAFLPYILAIVWALIGIVTIGSIYVSTIGWGINLVMGVLFLLFAVFLFLKEMSFVRLLRSCGDEQIPISSVRYKIAAILFILVLGVLILAAITHRVFIEGFAVFG